MKRKAKLSEHPQENFTSLLHYHCRDLNYEIVPDVKVLSCNPITTGQWLTHESWAANRDYALRIYVMYENYEKDGILKRLFMKYQRIHPTFFLILGETLATYNTLTHLRLERCNLTGEDINDIRNLLDNVPGLTDLNIDGNPNFYQNFWKLISGTNVEFLSLAYCEIDAIGLIMISDTLACEHCKLRALTLSGNHIKDGDVLHLAGALRINRQLLSLDLLDNLITNRGCNYLMANLHQFVLTEDENIIRKNLILQYIRAKEDLREHLKLKYAKSKSVQLNKSKKSVTSATSSIKSNKSNKKCSKEVLIEREIDKTITRPDHPFFTECFINEEEIYCIGNFKLAHLNLAFNKIKECGYRHIILTLEYQEQMKNESTGNGLCQIDLVGNSDDDGLLANQIRSMLLTKTATENTLPRRSL